MSKLEETIRNKNVKIYSSRFYEELKTFIMGSEIKHKAMKGHTMMISVMSFAIGVWLFDSISLTYSKSSKRDK